MRILFIIGVCHQFELCTSKQWGRERQFINLEVIVNIQYELNSTRRVSIFLKSYNDDKKTL